MAKLFRSNRRQAVRLPKAAEFPPSVKEVEVVVQGNARLLVPKVKPWKEFYELTRAFTQSIACPAFVLGWRRQETTLRCRA
jgi:virulence-associated protein VagC